MSSSKTMWFLLLISLTINVYSVYEVKTQTVSDVLASNRESNYFNSIYDLKNYDSTSYKRQSLKQRLDRLYSEYEKDRQIPREKYYNDGIVDRYWRIKCVNSVRRILVISSRLETIETVINTLIEKDESSKQEFDVLIESQKYHDKLLDMSNFYAQFISDETYESIQKSLD